MLRAYAQLLRIPNVFTALADICLGWMVANHVASVSGTTLWLLLGASACLYSAGMVWNDFFDLEEDRRDRPHRPLPSGVISPRAAAVLGTVLLAAGVGLAAACWPFAGWQPVAVAGTLVVFILLYDAGLKRTLLGPLGMGVCRFLNVLLGMSVIAQVAQVAQWLEPRMLLIAAVVGIYIVGVTLLARQEARVSQRVILLIAAGIMGVAVGLAFTLPQQWGAFFELEAARQPHRVFLYRVLYPYLLFSWAAFMASVIYKAIRKPEPTVVQEAVKQCILGLIALDALLAFLVVGWLALAILALLTPAWYLGKWAYST